MAVYRVEIHPQNPADDPVGAAVLTEIRQLGIAEVHGVQTARVFLLQGAPEILTHSQVHKIASELLADPVTERVVMGHETAGAGRLVEVHLKPGVMDPVAASAEMGIADLLDLPRQPVAIQVRTGRRYVLSDHLTPETSTQIARRLNRLIFIK